MHVLFAQTLSRLRHEKGVSQREASQALGISQALLSHYENGIREPGLAFVVKACDYYGVSADHLLGRVQGRISPDGESSGNVYDTAVLIRAADTIANACAEVCRKDPEMELLFRRMVSTMFRDLGKNR